MLEYVLARSWREECSCHSGSHGHSGSSREASAWTDRSHTTVFRFLGDGGDLVVESPFECAKQLPRRKAEVSALTLQPQVLLSKASPRCHSLAGGRREVKWESSCSPTTTTTTTSSVRAAGRGLISPALKGIESHWSPEDGSAATVAALGGVPIGSRLLFALSPVNQQMLVCFQSKNPQTVTNQEPLLSEKIVYFVLFFRLLWPL